ncbi:hypothetical protein TNCV_327231 [Trichonephila clavipes]|nr:hypothetical protein TNCV_327231 [Trichonephila clavipes]
MVPIQTCRSVLETSIIPLPLKTRNPAPCNVVVNDIVLMVTDIWRTPYENPTCKSDSSKNMTQTRYDDVHTQCISLLQANCWRQRVAVSGTHIDQYVPSVSTRFALKLSDSWLQITDKTGRMPSCAFIFNMIC